MSNYELDKDVPESFEFILGGAKYTMRYPNTEEITGARDLPEEKLTDFMLSFITPAEGAKPIKEALNKASIKVLSKFNDMIKTEMGVE